MSDKPELSTMMIEDVLERWPRTSRVFYEYKMACVGCALAPFYTLEEAADIYHLSLDEFIEDIQLVIAEEENPHVNLDLTP